MKLPTQGLSRKEVLEQLEALRTGDADRKGGTLFSLLYHAGEEVDALLEEASTQFLMTNALNPAAFTSLRQLESEIVAMTCELLHGPTAVGTLSSGGTESILLAVKTARDWARAERGILTPEMLMPTTVHPAFEKAAHYFGVCPVRIPLGADLRADAAAARASVTRNTILIVGSAPCYPYGLIDPIPELAALAEEHGILCHVDACLGGYLLPFLEKIGRPVRPFDFRVPGVTSMSADLHKYGYATKGVSTVLYRTRELRRYQFFVSADWSGGLYGSPSLAGSRAGAPIASAWAVLRHLGEEGYRQRAAEVAEATDKVLDGIRSIEGLRVLGEPDMSVIAFTSDEVDILGLGDAMDERGWHLDRQQKPASLHLMLSPVHRQVVEPFLADLRACVASLRSGAPAPEGQAAMYGMLGSLPDRGEARDLMLEFMDGLYTA